MTSTLLARSRPRRVARGLSVAILFGAFAALMLPAAVGAAAEPGRLIAAPRDTVGHHDLANWTNERIAPVRAAPAPASRTAATFQVTYIAGPNAWPTAARTAFARAVSIIRTRIHSSQVIKVRAVWKNLGSSSGILGGARATSNWLGTNNRVFPVSTQEARCACNKNGTGSEIYSEFNAQYPNWYFGTNANPPSNKYDFVTTVLHELIHGLGFYSSFYVSGANGGWGYTDGTPPPTYKNRFDSYEWNQAAGGLKLARGSSYPNDSPALRAQLTDGSVYLESPNVTAFLSGARAELYAPNPWRPGSSNSHWGEAAFPPGNSSAMMTPFLSNGEAIHNPGGLAVALLKDIGWPV
ncbi:MAG: hypothetical protein H0W07_04465 [Chloroflexi bacterium]|nr:hypothetical protein [Chloroflexota bacterium]